MIPTDVKANKNNNELFQKKKPNRGRVEDILFLNIYRLFYFFTLLLEIPEKTKLLPWKFHRFLLHPLEIPRPKTKNPGNSTLFFLVHTRKFHILNPPPPPTSIPPLFGFFWNSPINKRSGGSILQFLVRRTASKVEI